MIGDYPNLPEANNQPISQQPLILPGYAEHRSDPFSDAQPTTMNIQPPPDIQQTFTQQPFLNGEQPLNPQGPSGQAYHSQFGYSYGNSVLPYGQPTSQSTSLFSKLVNLWRSDPAYKVFFIALATVLISSIVCLFLISNLFKQSSPSQTSMANNTTNMSTSTPVNIPTPMATSTPLPTPTIESTTSPATLSTASPLSVEITSIPSSVDNNTTRFLSVTTNEPGIDVTLSVTYSGASPSSFQGASATTNSNGQATLPWPIKVRPTKKFSHVTAHVTVSAQDTNGQTVTSRTVTVQVLTFQAR